jgi:hypothetical protein
MIHVLYSIKAFQPFWNHLLLVADETSWLPWPLPLAEPLDEPPQLLQQVASETGLAPGAFVTLQHGAVLQTRDGKDSNSPPLLPLETSLTN